MDSRCVSGKQYFVYRAVAFFPVVKIWRIGAFDKRLRISWTTGFWMLESSAPLISQECRTSQSAM